MQPLGKYIVYGLKESQKNFIWTEAISKKYFKIKDLDISNHY